MKLILIELGKDIDTAYEYEITDNNEFEED